LFKTTEEFIIHKNEPGLPADTIWRT